MSTLTLKQEDIGNELNDEAIQEMHAGMAEILMINKEIIFIDSYGVFSNSSDNDLIAKIYGMKSAASGSSIGGVTGYFVTYLDRLYYRNNLVAVGNLLHALGLESTIM